MLSPRPRRKPGVNRELLIKAGLIEFGLFGYSGASTLGIAVRANVPQPHLYSSFKNKQELFLVCLQQAAAESLQASPKPVISRFVFQAVAALGDGGLAPTIGPVLTTLRDTMGNRRFQSLLLDGASSLLDLPE